MNGTEYFFDFFVTLLGFSLLFFVTYLLLKQLRRKAPIDLKPFNVVSVITCDHCSFKEIKRFEVGDYVFKEIGECPKCKHTRVITSIYAEPEYKQSPILK